MRRAPPAAREPQKSKQMLPAEDPDSPHSTPPLVRRGEATISDPENFEADRQRVRCIRGWDHADKQPALLVKGMALLGSFGLELIHDFDQLNDVQKTCAVWHKLLFQEFSDDRRRTNRVAYDAIVNS